MAQFIDTRALEATAKKVADRPVRTAQGWVDRLDALVTLGTDPEGLYQEAAVTNQLGGVPLAPGVREYGIELNSADYRWVVRYDLQRQAWVGWDGPVLAGQARECAQHPDVTELLRRLYAHLQAVASRAVVVPPAPYGALEAVLPGVSHRTWDELASERWRGVAGR